MRVLEAIRARDAQQQALTPKSLIQEDPSLLGAGRRYFGSWPAALKAAGILERRRATSSKRHQRGYWTRERIAQEIRRHAHEGHALHAHAMQKRHNALVSAATYHFGSWSEALRQAGFNPDAVRGARRHTCQSIIEDIAALAREGADLRDSAVRRNHRPLYWAAQKYFGSWRKALEEAQAVPQSESNS